MRYTGVIRMPPTISSCQENSYLLFSCLFLFLLPQGWTAAICCSYRDAFDPRGTERWCGVQWAIAVDLPYRGVPNKYPQVAYTWFGGPRPFWKPKHKEFYFWSQLLIVLESCTFAVSVWVKWKLLFLLNQTLNALRPCYLRDVSSIHECLGSGELLSYINTLVKQERDHQSFLMRYSTLNNTQLIPVGPEFYLLHGAPQCSSVTSGW